MRPNQLIAKFEDKEVRNMMKDGQRWWVIVDIIEALTESTDSQDYWYRLQRRENIEFSTNCRQLKVTASDGKGYMMDCVNFEGALRLLQSIPSPKVEPFKQWLAKVGRERAEEEANPYLALKRGRQRAVENYERKGREKPWIEERIKGIHTRLALTDAFKEANLTKDGYGKITSINHQGTFGLTVKSHKELKGVKQSSNLRDNMVGTELSFTDLSEHFLKEKLQKSGASTPEEAEQCAKENAKMMSEAREVFERVRGTKLASSETPATVDQIKLSI